MSNDLPENLKQGIKSNSGHYCDGSFCLDEKLHQILQIRKDNMNKSSMIERYFACYHRHFLEKDIGGTRSNCVIKIHSTYRYSRPTPCNSNSEFEFFSWFERRAIA